MFHDTKPLSHDAEPVYNMLALNDTLKAMTKHDGTDISMVPQDRYFHSPMMQTLERQQKGIISLFINRFTETSICKTILLANRVAKRLPPPTCLLPHPLWVLPFQPLSWGLSPSHPHGRNCLRCRNRCSLTRELTMQSSQHRSTHLQMAQTLC